MLEGLNGGTTPPVPSRPSLAKLITCNLAPISTGKIITCGIINKMARYLSEHIRIVSDSRNDGHDARLRYGSGSVLWSEWSAVFDYF